MSRVLPCVSLGLLVLLALEVSSLPLQDEPIDPRIVGGYETDVALCPYQLSLRRKAITAPQNAFSHVCGASIIAEDIAITAAHCISATVPSQWKVVAGTNYRNETDGVIVSVSQIIMHEQYYKEARYDNDVALLVLNPSLPLNNHNIKAIPLASEPPLAGAMSKISGWGTTTYRGSSSYVLLAVDVPIVSNEVCDADYEDYEDGLFNITSSMLCAGVRGVGGKDACQGDSGGPLVVNRQLAGVVSWGAECALAEYPGVYANVPNLRPWIDAKLAEITLLRKKLN
ncbi:uncharacterized protein Dwil_GK19456 [Drosophila willistoni]|uniref:trypsin n=1 Tax=Drosophila willistoni TaxID=7260 RepID=B4MP40_DROWI|nr:trypsin zeta [Drosophila willistoni]EDW73879.1 uncharacterized protein Dwil_GK19456 [Drosophila willistoni]